MSDAMTDAQKLIARLRKYSEPNTSITIRDPLDEAATDAADWITAALAREAALREALKGSPKEWGFTPALPIWSFCRRSNASSSN